MGTLIAAGRLADASQFPDQIDLELVREVRPKAFQSRIEWAELARALENGQDDELRAAILEALAAPRPPYPGPPPRDTRRTSGAATARCSSRPCATASHGRLRRRSPDPPAWGSCGRSTPTARATST